MLRWMLAGMLVVSFGKAKLSGTNPAGTSESTEDHLLDEVQQRAFRFFEEKTDPVTGLTQDRARNDGAGQSDIASIASTGFSLAALPVGVEHGWTSRAAAEEQALRTLRFAVQSLPKEHGFYPHFLEKKTGVACPGSEISSIDSGIFACGAMVAGQYFHGEVESLANGLVARMDWPWMLTNGTQKPGKLVLSQGWSSNGRFLPWDYGAYSEAMLIYLLGMGSSSHPLPVETWSAVRRELVSYSGLTSLKAGPIFTHQMPEMFFPMQGRRDRLGYDYWVSSTNACLMQRQFCIDHQKVRRGYGECYWGLNACDSPNGYMAFEAPQGPEDGTLSPTGALSSIMFIPAQARSAALAMFRLDAPGLWGRYGFADAYNSERHWCDSDVIGIDLGMALLAVENARTGLIWRLMETHPVTVRAFQTAGLELTVEASPRPLRLAPQVQVASRSSAAATEARQ